jgi:hypothetical protein
MSIFLEGLRKPMKLNCHDSWFISRDLNLGPREYEAVITYNAIGSELMIVSESWGYQSNEDISVVLLDLWCIVDLQANTSIVEKHTFSLLRDLSKHC